MLQGANAKQEARNRADAPGIESAARAKATADEMAVFRELGPRTVLAVGIKKLGDDARRIRQLTVTPELLAGLLDRRPRGKRVIDNRRLAVFYLGAQSAVMAGWWGVLWAWPPARRLFLPADTPDSSILAFSAGDWLLIVAAGGLAAGGLARRAAWGWPVLCLHAGAGGYAGLWCWQLFVLTAGGGPVGAVLMTGPMVVPGWLAWRLRPPGLRG